MIENAPPEARIIGHGIDLVDVDRFRHNERRSLFTEPELAYCLSKPDPAPHLAVRFAAKEATMKAMRTGIYDIDFADIEVVRGPNQEPGIRLHGSARQRASGLWIEDWFVSLTHTSSTAVASVIAVGGN